MPITLEETGLARIEIDPSILITPEPEAILEQIGIEGKPRITEEERLARIKRSFHLPKSFRSIVDLKEAWLGETVCLVGGGASIEETFPDLIELAARGAKIAAVNKTHDWLCERGLIPTFGIMADPKDWVATYMTPTPGVKYLLASQLHDDTLARFKDWPDVYIWHAIGHPDDAAAITAEAERAGKAAYGVIGGSTTTLRGFDIMTLLLGFRECHFFAMDSSAIEGRMHPYEKPFLDPLEYKFHLLDPMDGRQLAREYHTNRPMFHQLRQFEILLSERARDISAGTYPKVRIAVHGSGILPDWCALRGLHVDPSRAAMLRAEQPQPEEAHHDTAA